jgi:hypothetical protein
MSTDLFAAVPHFLSASRTRGSHAPEPRTTTSFSATLVSTAEMPSSLPNTRFMAFEQPSQVIATRKDEVTAESA